MVQRKKLRRFGRGGRFSLLVMLAAVAVAVGLAAGCSGPSKPGPATSTAPPKPPGCPDVQLLLVPGTYATNAAANPADPAGPLMKMIAAPISQQLPAGRVSIYFVPYPAQFFNPTPYPQSEQTGVQATTDAIAATAKKCPAASFALAGVSQGAAVAGDVATAIGQGKGPVAANRLLGVGLIADPNRNPATAKLIGPPVDGAGLAGARPTDFGAVGDRVVTFCAPGDLVCATPPGLVQSGNLAMQLAAAGQYFSSQVHSSYGTYKVDGNRTAPQWLTDWFLAKIQTVPVG